MVTLVSPSTCDEGEIVGTPTAVSASSAVTGLVYARPTKTAAMAARKLKQHCLFMVMPLRFASTTPFAILAALTEPAFATGSIASVQTSQMSS
jgi:hypothetical protein